MGCGKTEFTVIRRGGNIKDLENLKLLSTGRLLSIRRSIVKEGGD
jgi:hypothetical protein